MLAGEHGYEVQFYYLLQDGTTIGEAARAYPRARLVQDQRLAAAAICRVFNLLISQDDASV